MTLNRQWIKNLAPLALSGTTVQHVPASLAETSLQAYSPAALRGNPLSHTFYCLRSPLHRTFSDYLPNKLLTTNPNKLLSISQI